MRGGGGEAEKKKKNLIHLTDISLIINVVYPGPKIKTVELSTHVYASYSYRRS